MKLKLVAALLLLAGSVAWAKEQKKEVGDDGHSPSGRDLIGGLIDSLTCTRTTNRGFKGRCVPRVCCTRSLGVDELCTDIDHTCCYGGDTCSGLGNFVDQVRRQPVSQPSPPAPNQHVHGDSHNYPLETFDRRCIRQLVRRHEWNAADTRGRVRPVASGLRHVIVHHTDDGERPCWSFDECRRYLQRTQHRYQYHKDFPDIPWNFLIGENGEVFEGMGWGFEGYHTEGWNERSVGIAFIGDFDIQTPTRRAMAALDRLLYCGEQGGYIDRYFGLYGHRDMRDTECPGELLYDEIRHLKSFQKFGRRALQDFKSTNSTNAASH